MEETQRRTVVVVMTMMRSRRRRGVRRGNMTIKIESEQVKSLCVCEIEEGDDDDDDWSVKNVTGSTNDTHYTTTIGRRMG